MYELIYTSAPKGLIPGRSGFATVAMSEGMPPNLIVPLENLSGYNFTLRDNTFLPILNPPSCYYIKMRYGNQQLHIAGRVAPNGLDYSQRNNKIAHHLLFESAEELENLSGGVAGLFLKPDVFRSEYTEEPMMLPFRKVPVCMQVGALPARTWAELSGHAGFAAYAAERFRENPEKPLYLIYPAGTSTDTLLNLVMEVCALLNKKLRNYLTFSTYFGSSTASVDCFLRMVPDFSPLVSNLRRFHKQDVIELGQENELPFTDNYPDIYECACTGKQPEFFPKTTEQSLTQHTIKILADSGLPPAPVREMFNEQIAITVPPPPPAGSYKKFVFAGAAAVIIAAVASLLLYDVPGKTNPHEKIEVKKSVPVVPPTAVKPEIQPEKQEKPVATVEPPPALKVEKQQPIVDKPAAPAAPAVKKAVAIQSSLFDTPALRKNANILPLKSAWALLAEFNREISAEKTSSRINLPGELKGVVEIYPEMQKIGTSSIDNSKFVEKGNHGVEAYIRAAAPGVLPLQPIQGEVNDIPHLLLKLSGDKKILHATTYTGNQVDCIMPELKRIKRLYFRTADKVYKWENKFLPQYKKLITNGTVVISGNNLLKYNSSKMEDAMHAFIRIYIGGYPVATFESCSFYLDDWNHAVIEYKEAVKIAENLKKILTARSKVPTEVLDAKAIKATMDDLQAKANEGDIELTNTAFNGFLEKFFNVSEKSPVSAGELKNFSEKLFSALRNQHLDQAKRKQLQIYRNVWVKKLTGLEKFQAVQKEWFAHARKLAAAREKLKIAGNRMLITAQNIDTDISRQLQAMMTANAQTSWQKAPCEMDTKKVTALRRAINKKIRYEIISSNVAGE